MSSTWRAAAVGLDTATAACAAFNLAYFVFRLARYRGETISRAVAVFALVLGSLAALGESLFFLASLTILPAGCPPATNPWAMVRVLPLAGTAFISILVLRRLVVPVPSEESEP